MIRNLGLALLAGLLFSGCTSQRSLRLSGDAVSEEVIWETVAANQERVLTLTGSGRLAIETPEIAQSASFELSLRKPDSVLVRIEGPFGLEVGSALLTRREFHFYNGLENELVSGTTDPASLSRFLRMNITFDDLLSLFTGGRFFDEDRSRRGELLSENNGMMLRYQRDAGARQYWIEPQTLLIRRIEEVGTDGRLILDQQFSDFETVNGVIIPHRVKVSLPRERRMISVMYSTLSINDGDPDLHLDVPQNARRVRLH